MEYGNRRRILRRTSLPFQRAHAAAAHGSIAPRLARRGRSRMQRRAIACGIISSPHSPRGAPRDGRAAGSRPIGDRVQLGEHLVTVDQLDGTLPDLADPLVQLGGPHIVPLLGRCLFVAGIKTLEQARSELVALLIGELERLIEQNIVRGYRSKRTAKRTGCVEVARARGTRSARCDQPGEIGGGAWWIFSSSTLSLKYDAIVPWRCAGGSSGGRLPGVIVRGSAGAREGSMPMRL
jgi:hypothetical protein